MPASRVPVPSGRAVLLGLLMAALPAIGQPARAAPPEPPAAAATLDEQLRRFADRAGVQLVYDPVLVEGLAPRALPAGASSLEDLVRASGLEAVQTSPGTWVLRRPAVAEVQTFTPVRVHGSRLRDEAGSAASAAIWAIDRLEIERSGSPSPGELLRRLPQVHESQYSQVTNTGVGSGRTEINLRGMGAGRSLVLLDGHRLHGQDPDMLSLLALEGVELLGTGASAAHGSDAVAGLVNLRTRRRIEGWQLQTGGLTTTGGGGGREHAGLATGAWSERLGEFSAVLSVAHDGGIRADLRDHARAPMAYVDGELSRWARAGTPLGGLFSVASSASGHAGCSVVTFEGGDHRCARLDRTSDDNDYHASHTQHYLWIPTRRAQASFGWRQQWPGLSADLGLHLGRRRARNTLPSAVIRSDDLAVAGLESTISSDSAFNPFGVDIDQWEARPGGLQPQVYRFDDGFAQLTSRLGNADDAAVRWSLGYSLGWSSAERMLERAYDLAAVAAGLGPSFIDADGNARCGRPGAAVAGCRPVDLFNDPGGALEGAPVAARTRQLSHMLEGDIETDTVPGPAGPTTLGAGFRFHHERAIHRHDQGGMVRPAGFGGQGPWSGSRLHSELYAEARTPLHVSDSRRLELLGGVRWPRMSRPGDPLYQLAVNWEGRAFGIHLSQGQTYRRPTLEQTHGTGGSTTIASYSDPCARDSSALPTGSLPGCGPWAPGEGMQADSVQARYIRNPDLRPESGDSRLLRMSWRGQGDGLRWNLYLDWWRSVLRDTIVTVSPQMLLDTCTQQPRSAICADPEGRTNLQRNARGQLVLLQLPPTNAGRRQAQGVDLGAGFEWDRVALDLRLSYLDSFRLQPARADDAGAAELAGTYDSYFTRASYPRLRAEAALHVPVRGWQLDLGWRHIGGMSEGNIDISAAGLCGPGSPAVIPGVAGCRHDVPAANYFSLSVLRPGHGDVPAARLAIEDIANQGVRRQYSNMLYGLPNPLYRVHGRSVQLTLDWQWL